MELDEATFVAEVEEGAAVDEGALREIIESWEGYDYRVGQIEVV